MSITRNIRITLTALPLAITIACSNLSLNPDHITGKDAHNRIHLAFSEVMALNPFLGYITLVILTSIDPNPIPTIDIAAYNTLAMVQTNLAASNWASNIVKKNKYYSEIEVDYCAAEIRRTGHLFNYVLTENLASNPTEMNLYVTALVPTMARSACALKPVPDLIILRTGTEGGSEDE